MTTITFPLPCAACNADLAGAAFDANCPACGWPVAATIRVDAFDHSTGFMCADVRCQTCDYNLRTLPISAVCPECAAPVVDSLRANVLAYADPRWRRNMARGVNACLLAVIGLPVGWLLTTFLAQTLLTPGRSMVTLYYLYTWSLVLIGAYGVIQIAAPDPADPRTPASPWPRRIALLFPVIGLPGLLMLLVAELMGGASLRLSIVFPVLMTLVTLSFPTSSTAALLLLRHQAGRVQRHKLVRHSTALARMYGVLAILFAIMTLLQTRLTSVLAPELLRLIHIARDGLGIATGLLFITCDLFAIYVLIRYRRIFASARSAARQSNPPQRDTLSSTA